MEISDADNGFYTIGRRDVKLYCGAQDDETDIKLTLTSSMTKDVSVGTNFQFFHKGDGFAIYNPYSQKFVSHRGGIFAGCHH